MNDGTQEGLDENVASLRAYYEEEARRGARRLPRGPRVEFRAEFLELLQAEGRRSVVDFGSGPGGDGITFRDGGLFYVGLDLANGNGVLGARNGVPVIQGSIAAPPLRPRSFDSGWSMSVLMHVPEDQLPTVAAAMAGPLAMGAPMALGIWGSKERQDLHDNAIDGHSRLFSLRPAARNRELLAAIGTVERAMIWDVGEPGWEYQVFVIRRG